ncbi:MAG: hypothetical protein ACLQDV_21575 [Candidatus Binataceae bacterium]
MRAHQLAMLAVAGWFLMVAPAPESLGKFDVSAPMTMWNSHSQMFRTKAQCESFRTRASREQPDSNPNVNQFVDDDSMVLVVPTWASRCVNVNVSSVDIHQ